MPATSAADPRYPIGRFVPPDIITPELRRDFVLAVADLPRQLESVATKLSPRQLDTAYRPGGWTARQILHHLGDSHCNAYCRFKLALTENVPTVKPYDEAAWAGLADARHAAPATSLALIAALHERWVVLMQAMRDDDWRRQYCHPEQGVVALDRVAALYAWHGRHHTGHLALIARG